MTYASTFRANAPARGATSSVANIYDDYRFQFTRPRGARCRGSRVTVDRAASAATGSLRQRPQPENLRHPSIDRNPVAPPADRPLRHSLRNGPSGTACEMAPAAQLVKWLLRHRPHNEPRSGDRNIAVVCSETARGFEEHTETRLTVVRAALAAAGSTWHRPQAENLRHSPLAVHHGPALGNEPR